MNERVFINCSNHPSTSWQTKQLDAAHDYGEIIDIGFPNVSPHMNPEQVISLGQSMLKSILELKPTAVMCQGEYSLTFFLVRNLMKNGVSVLTACTERKMEMTRQPNGSDIKTATFDFVGFRQYID